eukprot:5040526-Pyramimonas_sp.AAC.1
MASLTWSAAASEVNIYKNEIKTALVEFEWTRGPRIVIKDAARHSGARNVQHHDDVCARGGGSPGPAGARAIEAVWTGPEG